MISSLVHNYCWYYAFFFNKLKSSLGAGLVRKKRLDKIDKYENYEKLQKK